MSLKRMAVGGAFIVLSAGLLGCGAEERGYEIPESICRNIDIDPGSWEPLFPPADRVGYRGAFHEGVGAGDGIGGNCDVTVDGGDMIFNILLGLAEEDAGISQFSSYRIEGLVEEEAVRRSSGGIDMWMWPRQAYSYFRCRESDPEYGYEAAAVSILVDNWVGDEDEDFTETFQEIMEPLTEEVADLLAPEACVPDL